MLADVMRNLDLYSIFLLGLLGTGHCIGMCGPLVLAIPTQAGRVWAHLLYHLGRVTTYVGVGGVLGGVGAGLSLGASAAASDPLAWVARMQIAFSFVAACFLLLFALFRLGILQEPDWLAVASPKKMPGFASVQKGVMTQGSRASVFGFGLIMGFLPCGLSYAAFSMALPSGGVLPGGLLLACFGLGTVPGLFLVGTGATGLLRRYRRYSDLLSGILMVGISVSLAVDAIQAILH
jgi:sulfite exporter TauE/SafE